MSDFSSCNNAEIERNITFAEMAIDSRKEYPNDDVDVESVIMLTHGLLAIANALIGIEERLDYIANNIS